VAVSLSAEDLGAQLRAKFPSGIRAVEAYAGTLGRVRFDPHILLDLLRELRDGHTFTHLGMVAGIDWGAEREVVYVLWSDERRGYLHLVTSVPAEAPHLESATPVFPSADWHERETWELVDVTFDHHPDLRNLLLPTGYQFHPLLRSFKIHEPEELEVKVRDV
jgi:NADH:ubiquinone oxidoreductase subunit C